MTAPLDDCGSAAGGLPTPLAAPRLTPGEYFGQDEGGAGGLSARAAIRAAGPTGRSGPAGTTALPADPAPGRIATGRGASQRGVAA